jgi:magnesium transporter
MLYTWRNDSSLKIVPDNEFCNLIRDSANLLWLDLEGDEAFLRQQLEALQILHPLSITRIFSSQSRAFLDEFDDYLHILLQETAYTPENEIALGVCHFILSTHYLITIHPRQIAAINTFKNNNPPARFFSQGTDVLFYHITEPLISSCFSVLDDIAELTEAIEDRIFPKPNKKLLNELFDLKKDLIILRKSLAPMREVFAMLSRRENPFVDVEALPFMSHLYDQLIRLHEISDTQRELVAGALEIYLSNISNRTNEIMMTLTIVSTLILPPTLIVGYYGMNIAIPETNWKYAYLYVLALIVGSTLALLGYFKKKGWF